MNFGSVCSGIEAASVAWHPLGWRAAFYSEVATFPSAVLAHRYSNVPNYGDLYGFKDWPAAAIDVLVGGTPCQSYSVAGLREGLADPRGALMLTYLGVARRFLPRWLVWENVPGVLSSNGGRDFAALLRGMAELGYGWSYRILDAQFYRLAQRRRRVIVVGCLGGWAAAAAVLFERESLRWDSAPCRESRETPSGTLTSSTGRRSAPESDRDQLIAGTLRSHPHPGSNSFGAIAYTLSASGYDASEDGTGRGSPLVPMISNSLSARDHKGPNSGVDQGPPLLVMPFDEQQITSPTNRSSAAPGAPAPALAKVSRHAVAFHARQDPDHGAVTHPLDTDGHSIGVGVGVGASTAVRRLTPREWERLQGFPDDYTLISYRGSPAKDGPRYEAIGNSMAIPKMRWIGQRIELVNKLLKETK